MKNKNSKSKRNSGPKANSFNNRYNSNTKKQKIEISHKNYPAINTGDIRLNKYISDSGLCSRREADNYINIGRVKVNGKIAGIGSKIDKSSSVLVNGRLIESTENTVYICLNKPVGITCTTEHSVKDNIVDFVNYPERIFPIGRLDRDSEGLILLTNDGDIVNKILRAGNNHEKEYLVRVNKKINEAFVEKMSSGIPMLGTKTKKCSVSIIDEDTFNIVLVQGLNRQIRRMCEYLGYEVTALKRVRIMNITINKLPIGKWRFLTEEEIKGIKSLSIDSSKT